MAMSRLPSTPRRWPHLESYVSKKGGKSRWWNKVEEEANTTKESVKKTGSMKKTVHERAPPAQEIQEFLTRPCRRRVSSVGLVQAGPKTVHHCHPV